MQRDLSSPMDASMSTRNQGQLVSTQNVVTQVHRVGDMREIPLRSARPVAAPRGAGFGVTRAQGLSDVTVSALGTTSLKWIGVSMLAGIVLWKLTAGRRAKAQERTSKAIAALKGG